MNNIAPRNLAEIMRDELIMRSKIEAFLSGGPKTIPAIAAELNHPTSEVLIWVMAMWRHGILEETGKPDEDGYYHYQLKH